jgi:hypothetical protein
MVCPHPARLHSHSESWSVPHPRRQDCFARENIHFTYWRPTQRASQLRYPRSFPEGPYNKISSAYLSPLTLPDQSLRKCSPKGSSVSVYPSPNSSLYFFPQSLNSPIFISSPKACHPPPEGWWGSWLLVGLWRFWPSSHSQLTGLKIAV